MSGFVQNMTFCQFDPILDQVWSLFACMHINDNKTTSGLKSDLRFDFAVPNYLRDDKLCQLDHDFGYFCQFSGVHVQKRPEFHFLSNF